MELRGRGAGDTLVLLERLEFVVVGSGSVFVGKVVEGKLGVVVLVRENVGSGAGWLRMALVLALNLLQLLYLPQ